MCCQIMFVRTVDLGLKRCLGVAPVMIRALHCDKILRTTPASTSKSVEKSEPDLFNTLPVQELVSSLSAERRHEILEEIQKLESAETKKEAEGKLASLRWRSRFGRPSSYNILEADPTGTFCKIPEGWLKASATPTPKQLKQLMLFNALPFIGFGFLDNLIMIIAGDYIDMTIGAALGISTLAAAALGNTISDLAGIGSAWYVEIASDRIGVRAPVLTQEQLECSEARYFVNAGRGFGVVVGCILGMFPLFFISKSKSKDKTVAEEAPPAKTSI